MNTGITNKSLPELLKSKSLKEVDLTPRHVNDETLKLLHAPDRLTLLSLVRCEYDTPRTAANVVGLVLNNTEVTNEGLKLLKNYPKLEFINVRGSKVTQAGIAELVRTFPKLEVRR